MDWTFLSRSSFSGLFDHFLTAWGIRATNLICWIIDFQGTCDPRYYYVLLFRPQAWIDSHETPSLARIPKLHLGCFLTCWRCELGVDLAPRASLSWLLPYGARAAKPTSCHGCALELHRWNHSEEAWGFSEHRLGIPDWKYCRLPPLVVLALSGPDKVLQWLLSQLLIYSFYVICGNELEVLALVAQGQKSLFPPWPTLYHLFYYHIYWCGDTHWEASWFFLYVPLWLTASTVDYVLECAQAQGRWMLLLAVTVWEAFWKTTVLYSEWHQRKRANQTKVLVVRN